MEETLQSGVAFIFVDNVSTTGILSRLLSMYGCEINISDVATEFLTMIENILPQVIYGVKRKIKNLGWKVRLYCF